MKKILYILMLAAALTVLPAVSSFADLGDFNDYDSGSDYDFGGGYDYDYGYGDNYYVGGGYYGGGGDDDDMGYVVMAAIIVIIMIIIIKKKGGKNGGGNGGNRSSNGRGGISQADVPDNTESIVKEIQQYDKNFSYEKFAAWAKDVFIALQNAWSERDFEKARPFEKEELYSQHCRQIQNYIDNNRINVLDRINVKRSYLTKYTRDAEYEYLKVFIQCRMTDYIKDAETGAVLKGDPNTEYHLKYIYTFMRKIGVTTDPALSNKSVVACPHCGAPTSITSAGKCEYCGFIVTTGEFDWVLSDIEAVK